MTLVANIALDNFALIVSDLRRTNMKDESEYYDDCPKVLRINNHLIVGYCGNHSLAKAILDNLVEILPYQGLIEMVVAYLERQLVYLNEIESMNKEMDLTFFVTGINKEGKMCVAKVSEYDNFQSEIKEVKNGQIEWNLAFADHNPNEWLIEQTSKARQLTPTVLEEIARDMIIHTAANDKYVSPDCIIEVIHPPGYTRVT